ncbi:MAG: Two component regulator three Y domain-containing protein, partial [Aurantibacter sp.]
MKNISKGVWLLFLLPIWAVGQHLMPPIQNYRIFEYKAASKNWGLTVSGDGELFVANNQGLLHFNGEEWMLNKLPNETIIRSVAYINDKIFTGSYEEFGYWEKNNVGLLQYTSLTHLIQNHEFTSEEFWQILPYDHGILFRSFSSSIYRYENDKITVIDVDIVVTKIASYQNRIIV